MTRQELIEFGDKLQEMHQLAQRLSSSVWELRIFAMNLTEFFHQHDRIKAELENLKVWRSTHERARAGGDREGPEQVARCFDANGSEVD